MKKKTIIVLLIAVILAILTGLIFGTGYWLYQKVKNISKTAVESIK